MKDILNNVKPNCKAQAAAFFSISALISEIWTFKAKKYKYFENEGQNFFNSTHKQAENGLRS